MLRATNVGILAILATVIDSFATINAGETGIIRKSTTVAFHPLLLHVNGRTIEITTCKSISAHCDAGACRRFQFKGVQLKHMNCSMQ